jgi:hypothetical protein
MKNFNPIRYLETHATSTIQRAAIAKLWRYFCLIAFPNFFTASLFLRGFLFFPSAWFDTLAILSLPKKGEGFNKVAPGAILLNCLMTV